MDGASENDPLLSGVRGLSTSRSIPSTSTLPGQQEMADSETDEPTLNDMMAEFSTSVGSLGLDGAIQGAPMMRRGSVSSIHAQRFRRSSRCDNRLMSSKTEQVRRIVSHDGTISEDQSCSYSTMRKVEGTGYSGALRKSEFLGGVSRARFWAVFSSILLVYFVACFDSTLMASSHPVITSYFHASNSASWLSTAFLLTSTAFQPVFGRVSDTFGRRGPFLMSIFAFAVGTIWCAVAQSVLSFIFARALCGFGAGGAMAMGAIINSDLVPIHIRGSYQSMLNLAFGVGSSLGAALGGFLADALGWRWEFGIQVPAIMLAFTVAWLTIPDNLGPQLAKTEKFGLFETLRNFDTTGSVSQAVCVTSLVVGLNLGGNVLPWSHPVIILALATSCISGVVLILAERRAGRPIMPLEFLSSCPRGNLVFSNFFASMTMNTILFNLPVYFQAVLLDSATASGLRLVLPFLFNMAAGFSTGFLITWSRRLKPTLLCGYTLMVLGSILLSLIQASFSGWAYTLIIAVSSMGQGFAYPSVSLSMLATSTTEDLAVATSTLILWRSLGTVMGVAASSLVLQNALRYYLDVFVAGPDKLEVIQQVRKSIDAVSTIPETYRTEVIHAYSASLRLSFVLAAVTSTIALLLIARVNLPRLTERVEEDSSDEE